MGWDDYVGPGVEDRIVVILVNDPDFESGLANGSHWPQWDEGSEFAAERGKSASVRAH